MQGITPFLWFNGQAEEAANFYTSVFTDSQLDGIHRGPDGEVMLASFTLNGAKFTAFNGGPQFKFSHATSFMVNCESQAEVDHLWNGLGSGGKYMDCGWLTDQFGLAWQIVPSRFFELMSAGSPEQTGAVMGAMMKMTKFEIEALEVAFREAAPTSEA